jgi:hypothetical protein
MELEEYLNNVKLNKKDPDYQIETFWYGLKNSMGKFYKNNGIRSRDIDGWSRKLNDLKNKKSYKEIELSIKDFLKIYAMDVMKYNPNNNNSYADILWTNIKRWKKITQKFNESIEKFSLDGSRDRTKSNDSDFFDSYDLSNSSSSSSSSKKIKDELKDQLDVIEKIKGKKSPQVKPIMDGELNRVMILFEGFWCVNKKMDKKLYPILDIFRNVDNLSVDDYEKIIILSLELNQVKMIDCIIKLLGHQIVFEIIDKKYPDFIIFNDIKTCGKKLCRRYVESFICPSKKTKKKLSIIKS